MKKWLLAAVKLAFSGVLLWFLIHRIDMSRLSGHMSALSPSMMGLALLLVCVQVPVNTLRWMVALRATGNPLGFLPALRLVMIGLFFNQTLPSSIGGDAVRIWQGYRKGLPLSAAINSVMLERVATLVALFAIVAGGLPYLFTLMHGNPARWAFAALVAAGFGGFGFLLVLDWVVAMLPRNLGHYRAVRAVMYLATDSRRLFLVMRPAAEVMLWAVLAHVLLAMTVYVIASDLDIVVTPGACMVLVPLVVLATTIPISVAGWGVREGAMVAAFGLVHVPGEAAFVLSVVFGLTGIAVGLPGGILWLIGREPRGMAVSGDKAAGQSLEG